IAYNAIDNTLDSNIDGSTVTVSGGSVALSSSATADIETIAVGIASSEKQAGLAGSAGVAKMSNDVESYITDSTVLAAGNLTVRASQANSTQTYGGAVGAARSVAGAGGSVMVNILHNTAKAFIQDSTVSALAQTGTSVTIQDWATNGDASTESIKG